MADPLDSAAASPTQNASGAQPDPLIGRTVNERFKILSVIARGGMGKVYKAEQAPLGRICAVKVLNPNYNGDNDPEFHKRFFLEASIASKLSHPNTVTIFDYGRTDDDVYYMAMEYLEGRTLHRVIKTEAPLSALRAVHIARQICRSLREAHGLGVVHRDLKPANIYLIHHDDDMDFVKVLDFGLVKAVDEDKSESLTAAGLFMGSPKYMAPEQIRGDRCTACTDVYALGVVMFEMLTGKVPYDGGTSVNTLMMHVNDPIPNMRDLVPNAFIPEAIEALVYRCMAKNPEDRFASMDELLAGLKRASGDPSGDHSVLLQSGELRLSNSGAAASDPSLRGLLPNPTGSGAVPSTIATVGDATLTAGSMLVPQEPPRKSGNALLLGALGVIIVAGGIAAGLMFAKQRSQGPATTITHTAIAPIPTVHVALQSTPPGAEVLEGDHSLGRTPLALDWTGADGDPARSHTFIFRLAGHRDATTTLTGTSLEHNAVLEAIPAETPVVAAIADAGGAAVTADPGATTPRPRTRPRPHTGGSQQTPSGYRGIDDW